MPSPTWSRLGTLFHAALELPPGERAAFLAQECGDTGPLRREVEDMLAAHDDETSLQMEDRLLAEADPTERMLGTTIGAYRLIGLLGRGGMGDVYLAERDDDQYERRVAFKLLRPGSGNRATTERFLRERQILAQLEHPHIAMLLDGGMTEDGRPYLVMQYVDGEPITDWCQGRELPLRERLELFRTVCDTVQAAHNNLVVHRDLKPANIMVTHDGQVRLLDFGIAKLLDETEPGLTMDLDRLLTPEYAAPEQVTGRTVTTATDVYALGMLLYELLTGEQPLDIDRSSAAAIERTICGTMPAPPSRRATSDRRALRGELDAIVLTALRKEPERRYQSARELGEDLGNYLEGRPVQAQGDSLGYRLRKGLTRHRWAVAAVAAFVLVIAWSFGAITLQSRQVAAERDRALAERARADAVVDVMSDLLTRSNPRNLPDGGVLSRENFIDMLAESVDGLDEQPDVQARLRELLAEVHRAHGDGQEWLEAITRVVDHHEQAGSDAVRMASLRHKLALAVSEVRGPQAAEPLLRESLRRHREMLEPGTRDIGVAAQDLAQVLTVSQPEEAAGLMNEAFAIAQANGDVDSLAVARAFNGLGNLALARGDLDAARDHYDTALGLLEPYLGEANPNVMTVTFNLALTLRRPEELARAESLLRRNTRLMEEVQGGRTTSLGRSWEALGVVLALQGRPEEAVAAQEKAARIQREVHGDNAALAANPLVKAGTLLTVLGRPEEALDRFAEVRRMEAARAEAGAPVDTLLQAFGHATQALARYEAGDRETALAELEVLQPLLDSPAPAGRAWIVAELATVEATLLLAEGRGAEAGAAARRALDERLAEQSYLPRWVAFNRCLLAATLAGSGRPDEARAILAEHLAAARDYGYLTPLQVRLLDRARVQAGL